MGCTNPKGSAEKNSLTQLVPEFLEKERCCTRDERKEFRNLGIGDAIKKAAQARLGNGKRQNGTRRLHSHQRWLRQETADETQRVLLKHSHEIRACRSKGFDALHELVRELLHIRGASEMYWYDTAFRIGISLNVYPQKVYLHRGTRAGAKALGRYKGKDVLEMSELPAALRKMKPYQVEDFLCMKNKKGELKRFSNSN
jgi:hypothetical protein